MVGALVLTVLLSGCQPTTEGQDTRPSIIRAALREGEVVIYTNTDVTDQIAAGFERRFPGMKARFVEVTSSNLQTAVVSEAETGAGKADLVWSSSMDIQIKLINDGYAQTYDSPEAHDLPNWAVWRDQGFGVTAEPIVFAYNRRLLPPDQVPRSHAALLEALRTDPERWRGKIATYDPETSGVGFMYLSADTQVYPEAWSLLAAIGESGPSLDVAGGVILGKLDTGERLLVYNMNAIYARWWTRHRNLDVVYVTPEDYHLSISRVAFIPKSAPHPNAARLFLDYLMSEEGQATLEQAGFTPVRDGGVETPGARPIRVGPALLANLDQSRRASLLSEWRDRVHPQSAGD
ncbi:ABC transporter substrate-binding protein [Brevundimonas staleyi]|uniref:ABC transporter substrate-binding protein n=1 Tax=Brevundimonas staleyi TaxID=74326 RepID=A0ABW0G0R7_9CAUL